MASRMYKDERVIYKDENSKVKIIKNYMLKEFHFEGLYFGKQFATAKLTFDKLRGYSSEKSYFLEKYYRFHGEIKNVTTIH